MKLKLIRLLNKILTIVNKVFKPKRTHTREELEKELEKLKGGKI